MTETPATGAAGGVAERADALLRAPWATLDDAALLAHFHRRPDLRFTPVIDDEEIAPARIAGILQGHFEFNGETHALPDPIDWLHNPSVDVEWHILLHKCYYLAGLARTWQATGSAAHLARWAALIDGWMAVTPPGFIAADVTGRRVQNWITSLHALVFEGRAGRPAPIDPVLWRRVLHSLHAQVEHLCTHLTPKRNHRTLELMAIAIAGVVFHEFRRAAHWRHLALSETAANVQADLLPDGVHCELSTDYHHLALRNWLQVRTLLADHGHAIPAEMDQALQRALHFALHVHQPSGIVPSFSDGDARGYLPLLAQGAALYGRADLRYGATLGAEGQAPEHRRVHFAASGYHVLRSGWPAAADHADAQHLVWDCGPLGEGNHGHFDALSFELAAFGRALVVDPGRCTYSEAGPVNWRVQFRHTAAHNTVCVDGLPQVCYTPKPLKQPSRHGPGAVRHKISGPAPSTGLLESADIAGPLPLDLLHGRCSSAAYDAVHERVLVFVDRCYWIVADMLRAPTPHEYLLNFQLGPQAQGACSSAPTGAAAGMHLLQCPHLLLAQPRRSGQAAGLEPGHVAPRYGQRLDAPRWRTRAHGCDADFDTVLLPWRDSAPGLRVRLQTVAGEAPGPDAWRFGAVAGQVLHIRLAGPDGQVGSRDSWFHARGVQARVWHLAGWRFYGRWLFWRCDAEGRLCHALSHAGAHLVGPDGPLPLQRAEQT